jgi:hypothetical protein
MGKFKLCPDPTFKAKVGIHVPGEKAVEIEFTFKHRAREELQKFIAESAERGDVDTVMEMATAWELTDAFTADNVAMLTANYIASPRAIFDTYVDELTKARAKN